MDADLAGEEVILLWDLFDRDLYVELGERRYGPCVETGENRVLAVAGASSVWRGLAGAKFRFAWVTDDRRLPSNCAGWASSGEAGAGDYAALLRLAQVPPDEAVRDVIR